MSKTFLSRNAVFDPRNPATWALVLAVLIVANAAALFARLYHYEVVDDAYISFQYVKNLAHGNGLVFNVGERVEGYTNFLWIVVLTPLYAVAQACSIDFTRAAITLNILLALVDLGLLFALGRRLLGAQARLALGLTVLTCALDNAYQGYAMSGLENHLVIGLMLGAALLWDARPKRGALWVGLLLALAAMARPDAALFAIAFGLTTAAGIGLPARFRDDESRGVVARRVAAALAVCAVVYGGYFLWRATYYGALLPNTFYLKVGDTLAGLTRGVRYTNEFFVDRYYLPLGALFAVRWVALPLCRWLLCFVVLHTAYVIYVGGDFYTGHRFYVVLLPIYYLLIGLVLARALRFVRATRWWFAITSRTAVALVCIALLGGLVAAGLYRFTARGLARGPYGAEIVRWGPTVDNNVRYMKWLRTVAPAGASMVVGDIGAAGFFADLRVIDVHGIIDRSIAHQTVPDFGRGKPGHEKRGTREYLLRDKPTYVKWGWIGGDLHGYGYYVFTEFPAWLDVPGLWVRDERARSGYLRETRVRFSHAELSRWQASGTAFRQLPTTGSLTGQRHVFGQSGSYVSSYSPGTGDRATGRLLSPPFLLRGDLLQLRVGGGRDPERLRVSLLVDGRPVHSATGHDQEVLGRREWDIRAHRGKSARLEIVDGATGDWGHIMVDEVVQWRDRAE